MKETLQAIFTPEAGGGTVVNYPLERIGPALYRMLKNLFQGIGKMRQ
jgi:hypothetical protein